ASDSRREARQGEGERFPKLTKPEIAHLRRLFAFLRSAYKSSDLGTTALAKDLTHFYTMVTAIIATDLRGRVGDAELVAKLTQFGKMVDRQAPRPRAADLQRAASRYMVLSSDRTTDASRRDERHGLF